MIEIDFYKDGFEIKGHDNLALCSVVSYGAFVRIWDMEDKDNNLIQFTSRGIKTKKLKNLV